MALLGLGMLLLFYWQPANFAFLLFKLVDSYLSRYSYLGIFILIFMAGIFFSQVKDTVQQLLYGTAAYLTIFIIQNWKNLTSKGVVYTVLSTVLTASLLIFYEKAGKKGMRKLALLALAGLLLTEFAYNDKKLWATYKDDYKVAKVDKFAAYSSQQEKQIVALKKYDPGDYRVSQTSTRLKLRLNLTVAYNYWPIASYVSSQDPKQLKFLESVGYRSATQRVTIVNTSVLGADSLLGVKYVLTGQDFPGLEKTSLPAANGKSVYRNPYALPLAFSSQNDVNNPVFTGNPFTYQEAAYSHLLGKKVTLYKRVAHKKTVQAGKVTYVLNSKDKKNPLYGNLPWS
ncbi:YfhO family protein [Lactobacillus equicursoris]|uniref:YfhO family protein n=1 Tax=Lactobacillus equicursoris TaxID=420645 RepID=UPI0039934639